MRTTIITLVTAALCSSAAVHAEETYFSAQFGRYQQANQIDFNSIPMEQQNGRKGRRPKKGHHVGQQQQQEQQQQQQDEQAQISLHQQPVSASGGAPLRPDYAGY